MHNFQINSLIQFFLNFWRLLLVSNLFGSSPGRAVKAVFVWYDYMQLCTHFSRRKSEYRKLFHLLGFLLKLMKNIPYKSACTNCPLDDELMMFETCTRVGTSIMATIYLQLIQNRYMFRSFTVLQCSHQHCVQPVASDVEVVGYI